MKVTINWMEGMGNNPDFHIEMELPLYPKATEPVWEQRDGLHRADSGDVVRYFFNDMSGAATHGFGGAEFKGTFKDGTAFCYRGAWSSRAGCVNREWPDSKIVDVAINKSVASGIKAQAIIDHWRQYKPTWGLAWCHHTDGEVVLEPTRNGQVKNPRFYSRIEIVE